MRPTERRPGLLRIAAGLVALLAVGFGVAFCHAQVINASCGDEERAAFKEFPQHGGQEIEPEPEQAAGGCVVRFDAPGPEEEIFAYYSERLRENGWEVEKEPPPYSEITEPATVRSGETVPAAIKQSGLFARRGVYIYRVSYSPRPRSEEAHVVVSVEEGRAPPKK